MDPSISLPQVRPSTAVEIVLEELRVAFLSGAFAPGERLNEVLISEKMGVSRGPVREAARRLEQQGWVRSEPRRGFFVRTFERKEIENMYDLRLCLESHAIRKSVGTLNSQRRQPLESQLEALKECAELGDAGAVADATLRFHFEVCALADNSILMKTFDGLVSDTKLCMAFVGLVSRDPTEFVRRNGKIMSAIRIGSVRGALTELENYLIVGRDEVLSRFNEVRR